MNLTRTQKKFIKKNLRRLSLAEIANSLSLSEKEILDYLRSSWSKEKYEKFLKQQKNETKQQTPLLSSLAHLNFKQWVKQNWKAFAFLTLLVFAVYFNSLGNDFVSDDIGSIKDNPNIGKFSYLTYFQMNLRAMIIFLTHKIFGLNPLFYRLSNILFHLGSAWVIFILLGFFFRSPIPLFTATIFAVHPILTESVSWISGGPYSNGAFFILFSFLAYIYSVNNKGGKFYLISVFSFILALLSNSKLIIFPFILLLYEFCFNPSAGGLKINWQKIIPFVGISGLEALYLLGLLGVRITSLETTSYQEPGMYNPLIQIPIAVTSYLELILWPKNLTLYHSEMTFSQLEYLLRLVVFLFFLGGIIWSFKRYRQFFFWSSFFIITLLPTLIPLKIAWIVAERYVYLGTLGIFVLAALAIQKISQIFKNQKVSYVLLGIILLLLATRTITRNFDWKNQDTLWLATAKTSPSSAQNHNNLGDYYARHGNLEKAAEEFKKAIEINPRYGDAYHNLANTYQQMGKTDLAIESYQKALSFNPNLWQSYQNLATIYFEKEKYDLAKLELEKAIKVNPQNTNLYTNLGIVYLKLGEKQKAQETFQQALQIDPNDQRAKAILLELIKEAP
ncbi:MAG: tetratricopeptide repeat protein [Patescibacteria group bacterium]